MNSIQKPIGSSGLDLIAGYVDAMMIGDHLGMESLRSDDFVLDFVHQDAFINDAMKADEVAQFWPAWFGGFPEFDYEVTRTIAGASVVVVQWTFTGTHDGHLSAPVFAAAVPPTGRTIRIRGVSVYDIDLAATKISKETIYMDLATLVVELGIEL